MEDEMSNFDSVEKIVLDVSDIDTFVELQRYLQKELGFPDFYGMNWDAFWDAITSLVELPEVLVLMGWERLIKTLPEEANVLRDLLERYNREYPMCKCIIKYV